jgi:hypothetical protein
MAARNDWRRHCPVDVVIETAPLSFPHPAFSPEGEAQRGRVTRDLLAAAQWEGQ